MRNHDSMVILIVLVMLRTPAAFAAIPQSPRIEGVEILPDQGWSGNSDVIWYDNFDNPAEPLQTRYLEAGGSKFVPVSSEGLGGSGGSVRARFGKGDVGAGGLKKTFGRNPMDYRGLGVQKDKDFTEIYWRMYVKHQEGWIGNPAKLSRAIAFAGSDWSQAMIAHIWDGGPNTLGSDPVRGVNANSQVVTTKYNDFDNFRWLGRQQASTQIFDTSESGRWMSVEGRAKLNSPGNSDGIFELFINGQTEIRRTDLNWVYAWDDYGINAVFLENYWNSGSPVQQERFFDDFVISTSYIGLAKSPLNPIVTKTSFRDPETGDSQSAWRLQVASDISGTDLVWDSNQIDGIGRSVQVDSASGDFVGSLDGDDRLLADRLYALRVQQRDLAGNWSSWSPWSTVLRTSIVAVECDFNGDSSCDIGDIDLLLGALGAADGDFDLDGSGGVIDQGDVDAWLDSAGQKAIGRPFVRGDANLDGRVDASDLNILGSRWQPTGGDVNGWGDANFNGDNRIDAADLNAIGRNWQQGVGVALAVPEPAAGPLGLSTAIALIYLCLRRLK